ncbi:hypothetical protein ACLOJK_004071, partial [Asimina triloba]
VYALICRKKKRKHAPHACVDSSLLKFAGGAAIAGSEEANRCRDFDRVRSAERTFSEVGCWR